jgi:hypothetical protein
MTGSAHLFDPPLRCRALARTLDGAPLRCSPGVAVRIQANYSRGGRLLRYSMLLIDTDNTAANNGRVLGYDNAHGYHHRVGREKGCDTARKQTSREDSQSAAPRTRRTDSR